MQPPRAVSMMGRIARFSTNISIHGSSSLQNEKASLQKGVLVEFQKEPGKCFVGVTQGCQGKNNWTVIDQNAETCIVRAKQIKLVVPGTENFSPEALSKLLREVELLQDPCLLKPAWEEMLNKNKTVDLEEMSLILYGSTAPEKCYSTYRLLASHSAYFECKEDGYSPLYEPRPLTRVKEFQLQELQEALNFRGLTDFVTLIKSAMQLPRDKRPGRSSWESKHEFRHLLVSLKAFALETVKSPEQKNGAMKVLECLEVSKTSFAATTILIQMGYFGLHENFDLLRMNLRRGFSSEVLAASKKIKDEYSLDLDKDNRTDLTSLKVFTIDTDNPYEIDDGLSAVQLPDGRFKVWIHVGDATRWVYWDSSLCREARHRCTSIYLPTGIIPMFPMEVAADVMSLRQGHPCLAVSVSVTLAHDGSVAESMVENSVICPTYKFSYATASELLCLNLEEETELTILYKAASLRCKWRSLNGALNIRLPKVKVFVEDDSIPDPKITLSPEDETSAAAVLVSEMMILCGEVIAKFGHERGVSLPYRSQSPYNKVFTKDLLGFPEGLARSVALLRCMPRADMSFLKPLQHASLGLPGYVQFTSPIRRYADLLAHYQVKAVLRGLDPPLKCGFLEASMYTVNAGSRMARKLQIESDWYWKIEYMKRQPPNTKYRACILRFVKDTVVLLFLIELGMQSTMDVKIRRKVGDELFVCVQHAQPRENVLVMREA